MRSNHKKIIAVIAIIMALSVSTGFALAYFSDYTKAEGSAVLHLAWKTDNSEEPGDDYKVIAIKNISDDPVDVITRMQVIGPDEFGPYEPDGGHENWVKGEDGWWYYTKVLAQGESTPPLKIKWTIPKGTDIENYDVAVVHESLAAVYAKDGTVQIPESKGWENHIDTK